MQKVLLEQLLATYFNLSTQQVNAATVISSKLATSLGLSNVRDTVLYGHATLLLAVNASTVRGTATQRLPWRRSTSLDSLR